MRKRACWPFSVGRLVGAALALLLIAPVSRASDKTTGFLERVFHDDAGEHKYTVFIPAAYNSKPAYESWPVILYLHGAGSRGKDNKLPLVGGLGPQIRARADSFPFVVVFPQCEDGQGRMMDGWATPDGLSPDGKRALAILDTVEREFNIDRRREILSGWSMGGVGAWRMAAAVPSRWSAVVIVSGTGETDCAHRLTNVPIWAFHGTKDLAVPPDGERKLVQAVRNAGGRVYLTEIPDVRHNIGHVVYSDDAVYRWMLDPASEPQPESIVRNGRRPPNEAEMGQDFVYPFVPAVEIPQAVFVRLDKQAVEALALAMPTMVPEGALAGQSADVHETRRGLLSRFSVTLSGINYRGSLEQMVMTAEDNGWATLALGLRNMTMEVGGTQVNGRLLSATAGPMQIIVGHARPAWLTVKVRPHVVDRRLKFELGSSRFVIDDDNWSISTPSVATRGIPILRNRISHTVSSQLVDGAYGRKGEIESQVAAAGSALVARLEEQFDRLTSQTRTLGVWPMPAFQPRFKLWVDRVHVDSANLTLVMGMTVGRPPFDSGERPLRTIERTTIGFDQLPTKRGLQVGISNAVLEGLTAAITDHSVAMADARDLGVSEFSALCDRGRLIEAIPDLARYGDSLEVRTHLRAVEPITVSGFDAAKADATRIPVCAMEIQLRRVRASVEIKTDQIPWKKCAEFDLRVTQQLEIWLEKPDYQTRFVRFQRPRDADISVESRFADGYLAEDTSLRGERIVDLFREGWQAAEGLEVMQQMATRDFGLGPAKFRATEIEWSDPFLVARLLPAATRLTNDTPSRVTYSIRGPATAWGGPYTLEPMRSHDFLVPYPLTVRRAGSDAEEEGQPAMGSEFRFTSLPSHGDTGALSQRTINDRGESR